MSASGPKPTAIRFNPRRFHGVDGTLLLDRVRYVVSQIGVLSIG